MQIRGQLLGVDEARVDASVNLELDLDGAEEQVLLESVCIPDGRLQKQFGPGFSFPF